MTKSHFSKISKNMWLLFRVTSWCEFAIKKKRMGQTFKRKAWSKERWWGTILTCTKWGALQEMDGNMVVSYNWSYQTKNVWGVCRDPRRGESQFTLIFSSWAASDFSKSSCFLMRASTLSRESPRSSLARKAWRNECVNIEIRYTMYNGGKNISRDTAKISQARRTIIIHEPG